jgi:hypothetical protein
LTRAIITGYQRTPGDARDHAREMQIDGTAYLARLTAINSDLKFDQILAAIAPASDFTGHIHRMQQRIFLFSGLGLMVVLTMALLTSRQISGSLVQREEESRKIQCSDFSESAPLRPSPPVRAATANAHPKWQDCWRRPPTRRPADLLPISACIRKRSDGSSR